MKTASIILLLLCICFVLFNQCEKEPEPEPEPEPVMIFYDLDFVQALIAAGVDANGDRRISPEEAEAVTFLDISSRGISDMRGIEIFVNLEYLDCSENELSRLDVSQNASLETLYCPDNQLKKLIVAGAESLLEIIAITIS